MNLQNVTTAVRPELATLTGPQLAERYNAIAALVGKTPVKRFATPTDGRRRLSILFTEVEALAPKAVKESGRRKRQKVFSYPPLEALKTIVPNSLRALGRDLLITGATLRDIEALIYKWDADRGQPTTRAAERAYGLVRLLHTYVGYALREEGPDENKKIFVMTRDEWLAWKAK